MGLSREVAIASKAQHKSEAAYAEALAALSTRVQQLEYNYQQDNHIEEGSSEGIRDLAIEVANHAVAVGVLRRLVEKLSE